MIRGSISLFLCWTGGALWTSTELAQISFAAPVINGPSMFTIKKRTSTIVGGLGREGLENASKNANALEVVDPEDTMAETKQKKKMAGRWSQISRSLVGRGGGDGSGASVGQKFLLTYFSYSIIYLARKPVSVVKSTLESEMGFSRSQLGLIDTCMLGAYCLGQVMLGNTVGWLGRSVPVVAAFALSGTLTAAFGTASDPTALAVLWGMVGLTTACVNPLLVLFVSDLYPSSARASAVGTWQTSQQAGGILANGVASYVLVKAGWRAVFWISGALVAACALPLYWTLVADHSGGGSAPVKVSPKTSGAKATATTESTSSSSQPWTVPGAVSVGVAYLLTKMTRYCLMMWLPYFLTQQAGMGPASSGIISTVFDATGAIGSILSGALVDRVLGGRMVTATLPFAMSASVAFALWASLGKSTSAKTHVALMAVVGFLIAGPDGILGGAASRNLVDYAGRGAVEAAAVSGMVNGLGSVGAILQGSVTSVLVDRFGWTGLFVALSIAMATASLALIDAVRVEGRALGEKRQRGPAGVIAP